MSFSLKLLIETTQTMTLTAKQKLNLKLLAEDIQIFVMTKAKAGKKIKCTDKYSTVKNLISDKLRLNYLLKTLNENFKVLDLRFYSVDQEIEEKECEHDQLEISLQSEDQIGFLNRNIKMLTLDFNEKGKIKGKKLKLPVDYYFYFDAHKNRTYFVTC